MISKGFDQVLDHCPNCHSSAVVKETKSGIRISCHNCGNMDVEEQNETQAMVAWNQLCRRIK